MAFCENCGAKLADSAIFCENCGAKVESDEPPKIVSETVGADASDAFTVFADRNWRERWRQAAQAASECELGLIVTRERKLTEALSEEDPAPFRECVGRYISAAKQRGVAYHYLNLEILSVESDLQSNLSILRQIVEVARPKYLFLIGNAGVMAVGTWENEACDDDQEVDGDLPYAILDATSPWEGQSFDFKDSLRVGRLPNADDDDLVSFRRYFDYAAEHIGKTGTIVPYGLSALVWQDESQEVFSHISDNEVDVSPEFSVDEHGDGFENANLLYFNLHGGEGSECWYGQDDAYYPSAFDPWMMTEVAAPHYIGVEACYGAQYDCSVDESILLTALRSGCLAFLGSSKIAYGTPEPEGSCADIIVGEYIREIADGKCAGDALVTGRRRLTASDLLDDSDIKTLAEFSLYGDPSACTGKNPNLGAAKCLMKGFLGTSKGLHIPMPDVRRATRLALAEVDAKISAMVDSIVQDQYLSKYGKGDLQISAKTFRLPALKLNQKIYSVESSVSKQHIKVYFDDSGNIKKTCLSK